MKGLLFGFSVLLISIGFSGCTSEIDTVKDGVMKFNKTITVGQALDNWSNCESTEWEMFETENGVKVVQFTCNEKNPTESNKKLANSLTQKTEVSEEKIRKLKARWAINGKDTNSDWYKRDLKKLEDELIEQNNDIAKFKKSESLNIASVKDIFQFTINKDDSFQISNVQYEIVWENGKKFSAPQNMMSRLQTAYKNQIDDGLFAKPVYGYYSNSGLERVYQKAK